MNKNIHKKEIKLLVIRMKTIKNKKIESNMMKLINNINKINNNNNIIRLKMIA